MVIVDVVLEEEEIWATFGVVGAAEKEEQRIHISRFV